MSAGYTINPYALLLLQARVGQGQSLAEQSVQVHLTTETREMFFCCRRALQVQARVGRGAQNTVGTHACRLHHKLTRHSCCCRRALQARFGRGH